MDAVNRDAASALYRALLFKVPSDGNSRVPRGSPDAGGFAPSKGRHYNFYEVIFPALSPAG